MYTNATREARRLRIIFEDHVSGKPNFSECFFAWTTINEVKQELEHRLKTHHGNLRLFYKNIELKNGKQLLDYDVRHKDVFVVKMTPQLENSLGVANPYRLFEHVPAPLQQLLEEVQSGFLNGAKPHLTDNGTSGTYFLENHHRKNVAIFKPYDEEPFTPNNPRNFVGELGGPGFRRGILSGESATREVAAYMLDNGFHGVPATTYVEFYHPSFAERQCQPVPINCAKEFQTNATKTKHGSLQCFANHDDLVCNYGSNVFSVEEVHKIAMLDIRILNCDRNEQNILVKKSQTIVETSTGQKPKKEYKLIPIDHGLSFPDNFQIYDYELVWMDYPQIRQPFTERQLQYIAAIDPIKDCEMLSEKLGFREICLRNFRIAETLLKTAAAMGFTLHDIGRMLYRVQLESEDSDQETKRPKDAQLSEIEKLVRQVEDLYFTVKKNGIKSTVEYQIGLLKACENSPGQLCKRRISVVIEEVEEEYENHCSNGKLPALVSKRSVSLPAIKKEDELEPKTPRLKEKGKKDPPNLKTPVRSDREMKVLQEHWDQIFFHYFEDRLKLFLKDRQNKTVKRSRFKSEFIE